MTASFASLGTPGSQIESTGEPYLAAGLFAISGTTYLHSGAYQDQSFFSLTFNSPQTAFGFYASDASDWFGFPQELRGTQIRLDRSGGTSTALDLFSGVDVKTVRNGSVIFFGVIAQDDPFTSITLINANTGFVNQTEGSDGFAIDDMTVGQQVPEPSTLTLWSLFGLIGGFVAWRKRKQ